MKQLKQLFMTGVLLAGGSMVAQAQALNQVSSNGNGTVIDAVGTLGSPDVYGDHISLDAKVKFVFYIASGSRHSLSASNSINSVFEINANQVKSEIPMVVTGKITADTISAKNALFDTLRVSRIATPLNVDSIAAPKICIAGNTGMGILADVSGASTNTPDPDIDRLALRGSMMAYLGVNDAASGTSYRMLKLHNAKSGTTDSWHIGFSANTNANGTGYQELVQLRTKKTASGPVFAIASDASGVMTDRMRVMQSGNVAIGLDTAVEKLAVNGKVKATGFVTDASSFPDYVFTPSYQLRTIDALAGYVKEHKRLPGMPSEKEVLGKGLDLAEVSVTTVEKVEELSLYIIQLNERIKQLEARLAGADK